jgi:hypothetical protein
LWGASTPFLDLFFKKKMGFFSQKKLKKLENIFVLV